MTAGNILEIIEAKQSNLTENSKKIASYVLEHPDDVQYMSITTLAEQCSVSDAAIFRFCKKLGFVGYSEFKISLAQSLVSGQATPPLSCNGDNSAFSKFLNDVYNRHTSAIRGSLTRLDEPSVERAVQLLLKAKAVYCFGQGASHVMAKEAWIRFLNLSNKFVCIEDSHAQIMAASKADPDDVIIYFSYSGATKDLMDVIDEASKRNTKIILVTNYEQSPAAKMVDTVLLCGSIETPLQIGSIEAKVAQLFVIDVLFQKFYSADLERNSALLNISADATALKHL